MKSRIYTGNLMHARLEPVKHQFEYPVYFYMIDLDELPEIDKQLKLFGYNRFNLVSLYDKDYLQQSPGDIRKKLLDQLEPHGCADDIKRIELVTSARYFGHVFNPISFYYCYRASGTLRCIAAEVHNTFGETHLYVLKDPVEGGDYNFQDGKVFHVSPFFDRKGQYDFKLSPIRDTLDLRVDLVKDGQVSLMSRMTGKASPLTTGNLIKTILRFPLAALMTIPRIHWQAMKLYFFKKLPVFKKPAPNHPMTIRIAEATFLQKKCMEIIFSFFKKIQKGTLTITLPDGQKETFGGQIPGLKASIQVHHFNFFWRLVIDSGIGFGEGYLYEDWSSDDPTTCMRLFIDNKPYMENKATLLSVLGEQINALRHRIRFNSIEGSRKNIHEHYDTSNAFFQTFLDESMAYSCAIFKDSKETLAQAQKNKIDHIIKKARIQKHHHLLEIGCGWGGFAIEAAKQTGCKVTGITISKEQFTFAKERVKKAGLENQIEIKMCDYRLLKDKFDRIVSIEMLEAVGHENLGSYFYACDQLLKPNGIAVIQVITIPDQRYKTYRRNSDFIRKHVFPGGHLPSLQAMTDQMTKYSQLLVENVENIGPHYSKTLRKWRIRFQAQKESIRKLGLTEQAMRKWEFYFCFCEAAFETRHLNNLQLVLTRAGNETLNVT